MRTPRIERKGAALLATFIIVIVVVAIASFLKLAAAAPSSSAFPSSSLRHLLSAEPLQRLQALSRLTDDDKGGSLTRPFGGRAHSLAAEDIRRWFEDAGLEVRIDAVGNVRGSLSFGGSNPDANLTSSVLLLGSHYDTVRGAGIYDGALGIVAAVAAVKAASRKIAAEEGAKSSSSSFSTKKPRKTVEVVAFSDEEGLRFGTTFLGSSALAGTLLKSGALDAAVDSQGVTLREALLELKMKRKNKSTFSSSSSSSLEEDVAACSLSSSSPLSRYRGYVEAHMEQGPTLEAEGARLCAVTGISGQTRLGIYLKGAAGHVGTVPMNFGRVRRRRDAAAGAAEVVVAVERICEGMMMTRGRDGRTAAAASFFARALSAVAGSSSNGLRATALSFLEDRCPLFIEMLERAKAAFSSPPPPPVEHLVCTVGKLHLTPNAPNVIAGAAELVADVRSSSEGLRARALRAIGLAVEEACRRRSLECATEVIHEAPAARADEGLTAAVETAARASEALFSSFWREGDELEGGTTPPTRLHVSRARASGAGHDALALSSAAAEAREGNESRYRDRGLPWAMLFVRDVGGVSHSSRERVRDGDVAAAAAALHELVVGHLGL